VARITVPLRRADDSERGREVTEMVIVRIDLGRLLDLLFPRPLPSIASML
jgi:hypothetical protein